MLDSSEAILDIYLHMHDVHIIRSATEYETYTHIPQKTHSAEWSLPEKKLADLLKSGFIYFDVFIPSPSSTASSPPLHPPTLLDFAFFFYLI